MAQWSSRRMSGLGPNSKLQQIQVPAVVSRIRRYNSLLSLSIPEHRTCLLINLHDNTAKSWWSGQSKNKTTVFRRACQVLPTGQETTLILFSWTRYCYNVQKIFIVTLFCSYFVTFSKLFVLFHYYYIAKKHQILVNSTLCIVVNTFIVYNSCSSASTLLLQCIIYCS